MNRLLHYVAGTIAADHAASGPLQLSGDSAVVRVGTADVGNDPADSKAVDTVAYGAATSGEGTAAPALPAATISPASLERKATAASTAASMESGADATAGNSFDSNDNSQDFVVRTMREPQSSASPAEP